VSHVSVAHGSEGISVVLSLWWNEDLDWRNPQVLLNSASSVLKQVGLGGDIQSSPVFVRPAIKSNFQRSVSISDCLVSQKVNIFQVLSKIVTENTHGQRGVGINKGLNDCFLNIFEPVVLDSIKSKGSAVAARLSRNRSTPV